MTISRRIENLSTDLKLTLEKRASEFQYYSLALDESTDATDTAQLAVFVRRIDSKFNLTEELANLHSLHDKTTGVDIYKAVMNGIDAIGLKLNNLCGVTTDGTPSMIGKERGFVALLEKERINSGNTGVYAIEINSLRKEFENRFKDLRSNIVNFAIFSNPFSLEPIELPEHLQLELVDMQCNQDLKAKFNDVTLIDFYQKYLSSSDYPNLIKHCKMMACLFGSTYICEQLFSQMKLVKSKCRTVLTDRHLEDTLRIATTDMEQNIDHIVRPMRHQSSSMSK
ncbi:General transcription factor II-I repeat domain-containing protein 2-like [Oopsacas minuta]|uniref:General transcription factor II-I repeat domain-containing protein 2-like n=1 Tax=Oopsacas minuta TaxID=111878 RepID=A0AAV7K9E8_9METZ|nr:General transcription factor II-I repeat domain-containing protein 2-like [Oopsacas minuta]